MKQNSKPEAAGAQSKVPKSKPKNNATNLTNRFKKSRDVGCYLGMRPEQSQSGERDPELGITKEGDPYLRTLLVQGAHHIVGWSGPDSDLRRWGMKLAARGGKNAKKRAIVAVARKLSALLHRLWTTGEEYEPLRNSNPQSKAA